jgi:hypothetical protein
VGQRLTEYNEPVNVVNAVGHQEREIILLFEFLPEALLQGSRPIKRAIVVSLGCIK